MAEGSSMETLLALEMVRVTEAAAIASARFMGRGDRMASDRAAVGSPSSWDTPPNSHSVIPLTLTPWLRATRECESSWASRHT